MATYDALDLNSRQGSHQGGAYGDSVNHVGKVTPAAAGNGDIMRVLRIPAGTRVDMLNVINDQLDSNGAPTLACKVGYTPVNSADGPAANDAYWAASGQTFLRAAANTPMKAHPIVFDFDVWVIITLTAAAATFAAGSVSVVAESTNLGTK